MTQEQCKKIHDAIYLAVDLAMGIETPEGNIIFNQLANELCDLHLKYRPMRDHIRLVKEAVKPNWLGDCS